MKSTKLNAYSEFARHVIRQNRYIHDGLVDDFLVLIASTLSDRILDLNKGKTLWRAQLGCDARDEEYCGEICNNVAVPFSKERMIPDALLVSEGRANPIGIAYLYLSTDKETAMSEVRPWMGSTLSLAAFNMKGDLKIVDFSRYHGQENAWMMDIIIGNPHSKMGKEKILKKIWTDIDIAFSTPVSNNEELTNYIPTQIIAEFVKQKGFDGIAYKSTLSEDGFNIVLFDPSAAHLVYCGLYHTTALKISFKEEAGFQSQYYVDQKRT